jgi:hypothetical protein
MELKEFVRQGRLKPTQIRWRDIIWQAAVADRPARIPLDDLPRSGACSIFSSARNLGLRISTHIDREDGVMLVHVIGVREEGGGSPCSG